MYPPPEPGLEPALFVGDGFTKAKGGGLVSIARFRAGYCAGEVESKLSKGNGEPVDSLYEHRGQQASKGVRTGVTYD